MSLRARPDAIRAAARVRGWDSDAKIAVGFRLDQGHVNRILNGRAAPGGKFVAAALRELGGGDEDSFAGLFALTDDEDDREPAAVAS